MNIPISKFTVSSLVLVLFLFSLMWITAFPHPYSVDEQAVEDFVNSTMRQWKLEYSSYKDLKVARVDVRFQANPKNFVKAEGAVITPVGVDIPGGQKILKIAAYPQPVRELSVDGIKALAWTYPGKCRRNLHYVSLCLVRQKIKQEVSFPSNPSYSKLPKSYISDALAQAEDLKEHSLDECATFKNWPGTIVTDGSYLQKFKTVVEKVASGIVTQEDEKQKSDDICEAMRKLRFSGHRAHVLSVMACRQLGIPCFGFISAVEEENYYIGTYSDQSGWIYYDLMNPENGFFSDPPVLLTQAPLISEFQGCNHDYWQASAAGYQGSEWGTTVIAWTEWGRQNSESNFTTAQTYILDQWEK